MLRISDVNVYESNRKKVHILKNLSLDIKEGEFLVILGKSGSGKSTLLNVLGGIEKPFSGNVQCGGVDVYSSVKANREYIHSQIGFVFQNYNLIENLTAYENIELALDIRREKDKKHRIKEYFDKFDMGKNLNKYPYEMSGGEQQRVSIIRTLILEPKILLCDEPTGALDSTSSTTVIQYIKKINKEFNKTVIMVTHDESYKEYADRIIYIKDGKIERVEIANE